MKPLVPVVIVALATSAAANPQQPPVGATAPIDHELAIVERAPIWQSELDEMLARVPAQNFDPDQKRLALESLIDGVLIDHTADLLHVTADKAEIDAAIEQVKQQNHIDDAALDKALVDQHYTRDEYREELARQIRAQKVYNVQLAPKITVTEDEVTAAWAKQSKDPPTSEQRDQVRQALWGMHMQQASQEWLAKRRAGAHIEVKP